MSTPHPGRVATLALMFAALLVAAVIGTAASAEASSDGGVAVVNELRALAGLPAVPADAAMRDGARQHSQYMAATSTVTHHQDPDSPHYTPEGDEAARQSNLRASSSTSMTVRQAVEGLMVGPFHGIGFVDPRLQRSGAALHTDPDAERWRSTYTINVLGARSSSPPGGTRYPVAWPGDGATTTLTSYDGSEVPDPLTSCAGWSAPTGLPILVQFTAAEAIQDATVQDSSGSDLSVCTFDQHTYSNPDGDQQHVGRSALGGRNAGVVIPRQPLSRGETYTVQVRTSARTVHWSFTVGAANQAGSATTTRAGAIGSSDASSGSGSGSSGSGSAGTDGSSGTSTGGDVPSGGSAATSADGDAAEPADGGAGDTAATGDEQDHGELRAASEALHEAPDPAPAEALPSSAPERDTSWWRRALAWLGGLWSALSG